jgi:hypothetical protein
MTSEDCARLAGRILQLATGSMYLANRCFTEQYKLDAAARLRLRGCVRHCDAVDVEAQNLQ